MQASKKHYCTFLSLALFAPLLSFFIEAEVNQTGYPLIQFEATTISFDTIKAGKKVTGEFVCKNTGDGPLRIVTVQASDGGTIAYWPEQPIVPGAKAVIKVEFGFTASRQGYQDKLFTVNSTAQNDVVLLHWKGYIQQ